MAGGAGGFGAGVAVDRRRGGEVVDAGLGCLACADSLAVREHDESARAAAFGTCEKHRLWPTYVSMYHASV